MSMVYDAAIKVVQKLRDAGFEAYFAGGCVRDELLGITPQDFDVATSATPDDIQNIFDDVVPVGIKFGVMLVMIDFIPIEVATFRGESGYSDGRRPDSVMFADVETDVLRRDFTINGMMKDPFTGEIIDLVGGKKDLERGVIRTIGDPFDRFGEDRLRMIRAVRFAARFGFVIDTDAAYAIKNMAAQILLVAPERINTEITKIISGPNRGIALLVLFNLGLLLPYFPELHYLYYIEQSPQYHPEGNVLIHTALTLNFLPDNPKPELAWAALLHDVGKLVRRFRKDDKIVFYQHEKFGAEIAKRICRRMRMSNYVSETVHKLVLMHMRFLNCKSMKQNKLNRFLMDKHIDLLLKLHRADSLASTMDLSNYEFCKQKLSELKNAPPLRIPISGKDLLAAGYRPGPLLGEILQEVEELVLEKKIQNKEEAIEFVLSRFPKD